MVNRTPIPTAQISILIFEDNQTINGAPDLPQERGLGGAAYPFSIQIFDAAGQYGAAGGLVSQDAFGNPLGTDYDPATGAITQVGDGTLIPGDDGVLVVKNLPPAKYGVVVSPPVGQGWHQTSTIEGTATIDAWVKANEPRFFVEFGPPGHHVFIGFVHDFDCFNAPDATNCAGFVPPPVGTGGTITGRVVNNHGSRPPDFTFYNGEPVPECWIGLNTGGAGRALYAEPCNDDSTFEITNVPPGDYTLTIWDDPLNVVIASHNVTVPAGGGTVALTDVPVFNWFARLHNYVFYDRNGNGRKDCLTAACVDPIVDDVGLPEQNVNIRWRDGRIYQFAPTDLDGFVPFDTVFPFFHWLVAEVDYARFEPTGLTAVIDNGGPVDPNNPWSFERLSPQAQPDNFGLPYRVETGPVLTQGFQAFLGQTNVLQWGKRPWGAGRNGGISGIVYYATTRAEDDPRFGVAEPWEPGVPRVTVNLYLDANRDGVRDDVNGDGNVDALDIVQTALTDSWDDNIPAGCVTQDPYIVDGQQLDCFDGLRAYNQVRPGVFDGGYAFNSYVPTGVASGAAAVPLPSATTYIVEMILPTGYELLKEEDKNVAFGVDYVPGTQAIAVPCVGDAHLVPPYMSMLTDLAGNLLPGTSTVGADAPFAGTTRPLCDRKQVLLGGGQNAAADFFVFTRVPKAAMVVGGILNDVANEFDPNAPTFGEKYAPPWMPVSFRDWTGREVNRVYADEYGKFNAMLPSTFSVNLPMPSGVSPNMLTACMNDAGPIPNPNFDPADPDSQPSIVDPFYNPQYSQFCYVFQYMPGSTTYLDTPVISTAAFTGPGNPLDCEQPHRTPMIAAVTGPQDSGPLVQVGDTLQIFSAKQVEVPNPDYVVGGPEPRLITRNHGFGGNIGTVTLNGVALPIVSWNNGRIRVSIPAGATTGQLLVTHANGNVSPIGVTVTVGPLAGGRQAIYVAPSAVPGATPIQDAIDAANPGDLVILRPGVYDELPIVYKQIQLQGFGAYSTILNARKVPQEKLRSWRDKLLQIVEAGDFTIPGQEILPPDPVNNEALLFPTEQGAGITVLAEGSGPNRFGPNANARIDGLQINGGDTGGAIFVNGNADYLEIANTRLVGNVGIYGGGIRIGHPTLTQQVGNLLEYPDASNDRIHIHHNHIAMNGAQGGAGGGIALYTGTDFYRVEDNFVCGNFNTGNGGGIGHSGLSRNGLIARNEIRFNQTFNQGLNVHGGGIYVGGAPALNGPADLTPGAGNLTIDRNRLQGNHAGAGEGGAIRLEGVNGADVAGSPDAAGPWHRIEIVNNMIVNNVSALSGAGISLQDAVQVDIVNNTIASNDTTGTAGAAFPAGSPNQSAPQPGAGIVSHAYLQVGAYIGAGAPARYQTDFSNPRLLNTIIWQNRMFYFQVDAAATPPFKLVPDINAGDPNVYSDLAVLGTVGELNPRFCAVTDVTGLHFSNVDLDPSFVLGYFNSDRGQTINQVEFTTSLAVAAAFDEGGNFIDVRFGPLSWAGDYHLTPGSLLSDIGDASILNSGAFQELLSDFDGGPRPTGPGVDIGADELP